LLLNSITWLAVNTADMHELWNFRSHVLSQPGAKVP